MSCCSHWWHQTSIWSFFFKKLRHLAVMSQAWTRPAFEKIRNNMTMRINLLTWICLVQTSWFIIQRSPKALYLVVLIIFQIELAAVTRLRKRFNTTTRASFSDRNAWSNERRELIAGKSFNFLAETINDIKHVRFQGSRFSDFLVDDRDSFIIETTPIFKCWVGLFCRAFNWLQRKTETNCKDHRKAIAKLRV